MIWSVSNAKTFERCQRQWFYKTCFGSARAKDPTRQRAYRLGKLQSISGWRGSVVDHVLSTEIMPALERHAPIRLENALSAAMELFDRQLSVGRAHCLYDPDLKFSEADDFVAFHAMEYGGTLPEGDLDVARTEVRLAIENFFAMEKLIERLQTADRLITQRSLTFPHGDTTVRVVPDVIVFKAKRPPSIIDWKVHAFGRTDAWLQLAVYAAGIKRCAPHADFPAMALFSEEEVGLLEVQLLTKALRRHRFTSEDFRNLDTYIAASTETMLLAVDERNGKAADLPPTDFPATSYASVCERCPYKSLCWETMQ